jgi:hypothetical protein
MGNIVRLSSQDGRGFEVLRGGSRSKIAGHRMSKLTQSVSRPKTALGGNVQIASISGAMSASGLATRKQIVNPRASVNTTVYSTNAGITNLRVSRCEEDRSELAYQSEPFKSRMTRKNSKRPQTTGKSGSNIFNPPETGLFPTVTDTKKLADFKTFMAS